MQLSVESDPHSEGHSVYTLRLVPSHTDAGYDTLKSFLGHTSLKEIIHADPETKENGSVHVYQNGNPYRFSLNFGLKVGYAELSHLDVVGMVHPDPEMRARGMFREMEFE